MNFRDTAVIFAAIILIVAGVLYMQNSGEKQTRVLLQTTMGNITIELYDNMPITAGNFEKLVRAGYYDGVIFHRVMAGFMVQGATLQAPAWAGPAIPYLMSSQTATTIPAGR